MAKAYCGSRISEHIIRDNAGFLICTAPVARSGWQEYRYSEINPESNDDTIVRVYRPPSEVTSRATIASGEGKPVVGVGHPSRFLTPESWSWAAKGHMQNVRVGARDKNGDVTLVADLHIQDQSLIDRIASGVRDLSMGYMYDIDEGPDGTYTMKNIRMNHVAVVPEGRAKTTYIVDERPAMTDEERNAKLDHILDLLEKLLPTLVTPDDEDLPALAEPYSDGGTSPAAHDAGRALDNLRHLRPFIEATGDRKAIDHYNAAVKAVKRQTANLVSALDAMPRRAVTSNDRRIADAAEWEQAARRYHRRDFHIRSAQEEVRDEGRPSVQDAAGQTSFEEMVRRARNRMLNDPRPQPGPR